MQALTHCYSDLIEESAFFYYDIKKAEQKC